MPGEDMSESVTFLAGREQKRYTMGRGFVVKRSEFVRAALDPKWPGSRPGREVDLTDIDWESFEIYFAWLHGTNIVRAIQAVSSRGPSPRVVKVLTLVKCKKILPHCRDAVHECLIRLFRVGDYLLDRDTRSFVLSLLYSFGRHHCAHWAFDPPSLNYAFQHIADPVFLQAIARLTIYSYGDEKNCELWDTLSDRATQVLSQESEDPHWKSWDWSPEALEKRLKGEEVEEGEELVTGG